jgi:hypothetical protein
MLRSPFYFIVYFTVARHAPDVIGQPSLTVMDEMFGLPFRSRWGASRHAGRERNGGSDERATVRAGTLDWRLTFSLPAAYSLAGAAGR